MIVLSARLHQLQNILWEDNFEPESSTTTPTPAEAFPNDKNRSGYALIDNGLVFQEAYVIQSHSEMTESTLESVQSKVDTETSLNFCKFYSIVKNDGVNELVDELPDLKMQSTIDKICIPESVKLKEQKIYSKEKVDQYHIANGKKSMCHCFNISIGKGSQVEIFQSKGNFSHFCEITIRQKSTHYYSPHIQVVNVKSFR
jgi:hypothetical protein